VIKFRTGCKVSEAASPSPNRIHNLFLLGRVVSSGFAFISADYQLMPPANGHDILDDIKDLFTFLRHNLNTLLDDHCTLVKFHIDPTSIAVAGTSAGGFCAYLAAIHAVPKPKAVLGIYALLGDCLVRVPLAIDAKISVFNPHAFAEPAVSQIQEGAVLS
jgi:acetyl esterase/lipase